MVGNLVADCRSAAEPTRPGNGSPRVEEETKLLTWDPEPRNAPMAGIARLLGVSLMAMRLLVKCLNR